MEGTSGRINGPRSLILLIIAGAVSLTLMLPAPAAVVDAQEISVAQVSFAQPSGAQVYADRCASCHQDFGEGVEGTFPPLAGNPSATVAEYVASTITEGRTGSLQVFGVVYDTDMPAVDNISDDEIVAVVDYVVEIASRVPEPAATPDAAEPTEPPSAARGRQLFTGGSRFSAGGASCSSCHTAGSVGNLSGPGLGPDLTSAYATFGGDAGLSAWLSKPPSKTMDPIFADRPLTDTELGHLAAFLADAPSEERQSGPDRLLLAGLGGLVALVLAMAYAWRDMRQTYVSKLRSNR